MDLDSLIPIVAIIFTLGPLSVLGFSYTPLGRAIVKRLSGTANAADDRLLEVQDELERLQEQLVQQDARFEELHDRLDFAERLLARGSPAADDAKAFEDAESRLPAPVERTPGC